MTSSPVLVRVRAGCAHHRHRPACALTNLPPVGVRHSQLHIVMVQLLSAIDSMACRLTGNGGCAVLEDRIGAGYVPSGSSVRRGGRYKLKLAAAAAIVAAVAVLAGTAARALTAGRSHGRHASAPTRQWHSQRANGPVWPLRVLSVSPSAGATRQSGDTSVQITFSAPVATTTAVPQLRPKAAAGLAVPDLRQPCQRDRADRPV